QPLLSSLFLTATATIYIYTLSLHDALPIFFAIVLFRGASKRGIYGDAVEELNWSVGQMLQTLRDDGLDKNTLVVFTSDNGPWLRSEEHTSELQSLRHLVCRLLLEKKKKTTQ